MTFYSCLTQVKSGIGHLGLREGARSSLFLFSIPFYSVLYPQLPHHVVIGKACQDSTRFPVVLGATFPIGKGNICGGENHLVAELLGNGI